MHGHNKAMQAKVGASEGAKELCGKQENEGKATRQSPEEKKECICRFHVGVTATLTTLAKTMVVVDLERAGKG